MEREIEVETQKVVDLKICLNRLVPIARLPPELLSEIFLQCLEVNTVSNRPTHRVVEHKDRWTVTHICHYWREVALRCPSLWSQIEVSGPESEHLNELLTRSKKASLTVHADIYDPRYKEGLKTVLNEIDRIETLEISTVRTVFSNIFDTQPTSAPRLRRIAIKNASASADGIPPFFAACSLPKLREVQLYNFPILFNHPFFAPTLTRLAVSSFASALLPPPRVSDLTRVLTDMPLLQHLEYAGVLIGDDAAPRNIALTRLQCLNLYNGFSGQIHPYVKLLDQLCIPASAKVFLDFTSAELTDILLHLTAPTIRMLTGDGRIGDAPAPPRAFSIRNLTDGSVGCILGFWPEAVDIKKDCRCSPALPPFRIALPWAANRSDETWAFCSALPLANIEACTLGCCPRQPQVGVTVTDWRNAFGQMKNLTWLRVIGEGGIQFPSLLEHMNHPDGSGTKGSEKLETIIMEGVKFRTNKGNVTYIRDLLRCTSAVPNLKELKFKECPLFYESDFSEFKRRKIPATWDGFVDTVNVGGALGNFMDEIGYGFVINEEEDVSDGSLDGWDSNMEEYDDDMFFGIF